MSNLGTRWALTNPHISMHIPSESRIAFSTQRKRSGHPRRPPLSLTSIISNLHLLLRVPSFARWPLSLHFFAPEVYAAWQRWDAKTEDQLREGFMVLTDFGHNNNQSGTKNACATAPNDSQPEDGENQPAWGIHALPLDYEPLSDYVEKAQDVLDFERQGDCAVCHETLSPGEGLQAICTKSGCEAAGHLSCWSRHMLGTNRTDDILPLQGNCPKCGGHVQWAEMMKELTLRTRAPKEVEKLLKRKKRRVTTKPRAQKT